MITTIIALSIALIVIINKDDDKIFVNARDYNKFVMNKKIPKNIFISISNKEILTDDNNKVNKVIQKTIKDFPDYNVKVYDDQEIYEEVKSFGDDLLTICYEEIIPNAYKCDIFRLVVLYKYGGIYIDAGMEIIQDNFTKLLNENEMIFTRDSGFAGKYDIMNGFMITIKENPFILSVIEKIKHNISHFNYTDTTLGITGPTCVGVVYKDYFGYNCYEGQQFSNIYILKHHKDTSTVTLENKNIQILKPKVRDNLGNTINKLSDKHYSKLWYYDKVFYQLAECDWSKTAKNYFINEEGYLCAHLLNKKGYYQFSSIQYEPNTKYKNDNGNFIKI